MTCILSYNILIGGTNRVEYLMKIIRSVGANVVGLVEAIDEQVIKDLATQLGMQYCLSGHTRDKSGGQGAVLSHFPIIDVKIHTNAIITKQPLLEVCVEEIDGQQLTVFVTHLTADFSSGWIANQVRRREIQEVLRIMAFHRGTKHILMGDFNCLAPGDRLQGSSFLSYITNLDLYYQLQPDISIQAPDLDFVTPSALCFVKPFLAVVPKSKLLSALLDSVDAFYAPRGGIDLLIQAGYIDCFRYLHPDKPGFTWPAPIPSGRIDFIFASPELEKTLNTADVIIEGEGIYACQASDHLPLFAAFSHALAE